MISLVELPLELQQLLKLGIEFVVVFALTELAKFLPFDISGYKAQIVAALFSAVMVLLNGFLGLIPPEYEGIVVAALQFLVVLLGAFGVYAAYRQLKRK